MEEVEDVDLFYIDMIPYLESECERGCQDGLCLLIRWGLAK